MAVTEAQIYHTLICAWNGVDPDGVKPDLSPANESTRKSWNNVYYAARQLFTKDQKDVTFELSDALAQAGYGIPGDTPHEIAHNIRKRLALMDEMYRSLVNCRVALRYCLTRRLKGDVIYDKVAAINHQAERVSHDYLERTDKDEEYCLTRRLKGDGQ